MYLHYLLKNKKSWKQGHLQQMSHILHRNLNANSCKEDSILADILDRIQLHNPLITEKRRSYSAEITGDVYPILNTVNMLGNFVHCKFEWQLPK